eukprot:6370637-Prymnesium_polylepis.1
MADPKGASRAPRQLGLGGGAKSRGRPWGAARRPRARAQRAKACPASPRPRGPLTCVARKRRRANQVTDLIGAINGLALA